MHRGSLVDILFEKSPLEQPTPSCPHSQTTEKPRKPTHHDFSVRHGQQKGLKSNKIIKITQFNSSLVIGEDKMLQSSATHGSSPSPQKNFNIKKIADFKNKVMMNAQKTVQIQLKKKDQEFSNNLKPSTAKISSPQKGSISRALVMTKCNVHSEVPNLDNLLSSFHIADEVFQKTGQETKAHQLHNIYFSHFPKVEASKDLLAETSGSWRDQLGKEEYRGDDRVYYLEQCPTPVAKRVYSPRKVHSRHIMQQKKYQENLEKQKRQILEMKKELNKNYSRPFNPPENISAQSYIIYQTDLKKINYNPKLQLKREDNQEAVEQKKMFLNSHKIIASLNPRAPTEIASLTKVMTCILTLEIAHRFHINISQEFITIGPFEQNIGGTSARIKKGEIYSIEQLLYGLMLPSGNDASLALAVWGGKKLLQSQKAQSNSESDQMHFMKKESYYRFIAEMNNKAGELYMQKTKYANSHGLSNPENKSCAFDLGILCEYAMNNAKFREIVSTKNYQCQIQMEEEPSDVKLDPIKPEVTKCKLLKKDSLFDPSEGMMELQEMANTGDFAEQYNEEEQAKDSTNAATLTKVVQWQNSHLLLQSKPDLYIGIKTGVTTTAGPCLASCICFRGRKFIIVVLNSKSMKQRFKDTENLRKWLFNKQGFKYVQKEAACSQTS